MAFNYLCHGYRIKTPVSAFDTPTHCSTYIYLYPDEAILQRKLQGYIPDILSTEASMQRSSCSVHLRQSRVASSGV